MKENNPDSVRRSWNSPWDALRRRMAPQVKALPEEGQSIEPGEDEC